MNWFNIISQNYFIIIEIYFDSIAVDFSQMIKEKLIFEILLIAVDFSQLTKEKLILEILLIAVDFSQLIKKNKNTHRL